MFELGHNENRGHLVAPAFPHKILFHLTVSAHKIMAIVGYREYTAWNVVKFTQIVVADSR